MEVADETLRTYVRLKGVIVTANKGSNSGASSHDLLGNDAGFVDLAVLSSRATASLRRVQQGHNLDSRDLSTLESLASLMVQAAHAVEFFATHGTSGRQPTSALASQVDAAIDTIQDVSGTGDFADFLERVASQLRAAREGDSSAATDRLIEILRSLSDSALRETGRVGEHTVAL